jgi:hypothetical protein
MKSFKHYLLSEANTFDLSNAIKILLEGQNEKRAEAMLRKANKSDVYNDLLSITKPYKQHPAGKNNKHLPMIVKWYLDGISIDILRNYYNRFIRNNNINKKPIDKMSFNDFEQLVDSAVKKISGKRKSVEEFGEPYYENKDVKIFLGDTKEKCIEYGQVGKYGFCISRVDSSNLFHGYRSNGATFYFVYFKQKQENAPEGFVVIHAYPDNMYRINYASENVDFKKSKEEIIEEFPVLDSLFKNVIVHKPWSEKEERMYNYVQNTDFLKLKNINDKLLYIELGHSLDGYWDDILKSIPENEFRTILKKYIEVGASDIPEHIIDKYPKLKKRYIQKLKQRIQIKLQTTNDDGSLTEDELKYLPEELKPFVFREFNEDSGIYEYFLDGIEYQSKAIQNNPSKEAQLAAIKRDVRVIQFMDNLSKDVQLAAVKQDGWAIQYIIDKGIIPSEEIQLAAVKQHGHAIQYIIDKGITPSKNVQLAAVSQNGRAIRFIDNPSEEMQLAAVNQNGWLLKFIIGKGIIPSEEIQLAAVKEYGYAIQHIINKGIIPSPAVQLAAVKQTPKVFEYIKNPAPEVIEYLKSQGINVQ